MTERLMVRDCLSAGFCRRGVRAKCETLGIPFETFFKEGIDIEEAARVDDHHVQRAVIVARKRIAKG